MVLDVQVLYLAERARSPGECIIPENPRSATTNRKSAQWQKFSLSRVILVPHAEQAFPKSMQ
jgi:hypothetical protein